MKKRVMMSKTVQSAHERIDGLEKEVVAIRTLIDVQFRDLFNRVKRIEMVFLSVGAAIIGLLLKLVLSP
tara:strand:+ start:108 stop:314 length:207 start_codon:yes stop_codon:yes gene_type:complete